MILDDFIKIVLIGVSATIGAIFGILRSRIFSSKNPGLLHYSFLGLSIITFFLSLAGIIFYRTTLFQTENGINYFGITIMILGIVLSPIMFFVAKKHLAIKDVFNTSELNPIVNKFTSMADRTSVKLFGGDLNFFGNTPDDMESNEQYSHLKSLNFQSILIICENPKNNTQKIRYGKILTDLPQTELKFYNPDKADLRIRGRMIEVDGVTKLLMYRKLEPKTYQAIERNSGESEGVLYTNIWDLIWALANIPNYQEIQQYKSLANT